MVVVVVVVVVGTIGDLELDHGNPNLMRYHQLWLQKVSSSVGSIIETVMFDCVHLHCEVDHEDSKSCMLMMNHYHTNFGYKKLSSSEDIVQTNIKPLNLCCDFDLEHSNQILTQQSFFFKRHSGLMMMMMYHQSLVAKGLKKKKKNQTAEWHILVI